MLRPAGAVRSLLYRATVRTVPSSPSGNFHITHAGRPAVSATMTTSSALFSKIQFIVIDACSHLFGRRRLTSCHDHRGPTWTSPEEKLIGSWEIPANAGTAVIPSFRICLQSSYSP